MPLGEGCREKIRASLELLQRQNGQRVNGRPQLIVVGCLSTAQLVALNALRLAQNMPPTMVSEVTFLGTHLYNSRIFEDGYSIEDVLEQIESAMDENSVVHASPKMTLLRCAGERQDRYGNTVKDEIVLECTSRHPRAELYSVIPKGDDRKPSKKGSS